MSDNAKRLKASMKPTEVQEKQAPADEQAALRKIQSEAKAVGTTLKSGGKGGLPASLVLGAMRRDKFRCKACGSKKDIEVHHRGGIVASPKLNRLGHKNTLENIVTICPTCHDKAHNEARRRGLDSSQITPKGDEGTDRDEGKPDAKPPAEPPSKLLSV